MKPRLVRLLLLACIAAASFGSTLLISSGETNDPVATHHAK